MTEMVETIGTAVAFGLTWPELLVVFIGLWCFMEAVFILMDYLDWKCN